MLLCKTSYPGLLPPIEEPRASMLSRITNRTNVRRKQSLIDNLLPAKQLFLRNKRGYI